MMAETHLLESNQHAGQCMDRRFELIETYSRFLTCDGSVTPLPWFNTLTHPGRKSGSNCIEQGTGFALGWPVIAERFRCLKAYWLCAQRACFRVRGFGDGARSRKLAFA